ncbi:hypothetical protein MKJ04_02330 [Pontibacter sp. E15-1]|uniref:hypothetical protein n=1 Tax=Pontibacter sp. E15-1 TaxID=2919918 RepID=UPI001F4FAE45|nr:hypothetical protein [Pontibacter sp. E15-1]MCJ8163661.1 hypothetical protein [Pontibacter sp. E15-1]
MRKQKNTGNKAKHWLKIGAWIVGVALLLFAGLIFFTDWLERKLEHTVAQQSNGVYSLQLYGFQVSPFAGAVSADSLSLVPDYARWEELRSQKKEVSRTLLDLSTGTVDLTGLNFLKMLLGKGVSLDRLAVERPDLLLTLMQEDTTQQHKPLHQTVRGMLKGMRVGAMDINSARLRYRKYAVTSVNLFSMQRFDFAVNDFQLDSQSFAASNRAYYAQNITLQGTGIQYLFPDGAYQLTSDTLRLSTAQRNLRLQQLMLTPTKAPAELARSKGKAVSYMQLDVPEIRLTGLDYPAHSRENSFEVRHVAVREPALRVFKDKQNFKNKGAQPLPHELAQHMKAKFCLDSVEIENGFIRYAELVPKAIKRGHINLQNLHMTLRNVSNMPRYTSDKKPAVIKATGKVMGKVQMQMTVYMPLLNKNGYHRIEGEIKSGNPEILNPILAPTAFVRFEKGYVNSGRFEVELTNKQAVGSLRLLYQNLKIDILSKGTGGEQSFGKKVLTALANLAVIKESNPGDKGEKPRIGKINVTRNPENSVFSYWVDCLMDGFMSSAGLGGKAEKL